MKRIHARRQTVLERREAVAELSARGLSERKIAASLERSGLINQRTGRAWSIGIIHGDLAALENEWRDQTAKTIAEHRGRLLAEVRAAKRHCWRERNMRTLRGFIEMEIRLLGLAHAVRLEINSPPAPSPYGNIDPSTLIEALERLPLIDNQSDRRGVRRDHWPGQGSGPARIVDPGRSRGGF